MGQAEIRRLAEIRKRQHLLAREAEVEGRGLTAEERLEVEALWTERQLLQGMEQAARERKRDQERARQVQAARQAERQGGR